jgi:hypothetical protein
VTEPSWVCMIRCIRASVSRSTEEVASSNTNILQRLLMARTRATSRQCPPSTLSWYSQSCLSPTLKFPPSPVTSASNCSLSRRPDPGLELFRTTARRSLSSASDRKPFGSMLALKQLVSDLSLGLIRTVQCLRRGKRPAE